MSIHFFQCDDTRGCIVLFWPPDDEHVCAKNVEAWNKLITKFSASSWLILRLKKRFVLSCVDYAHANHLSFRWPYIVINSCNKTNWLHWFLKFIFWNKILHVSDSSEKLVHLVGFIIRMLTIISLFYYTAFIDWSL